MKQNSTIASVHQLLIAGTLILPLVACQTDHIESEAFSLETATASDGLAPFLLDYHGVEEFSLRINGLDAQLDEANIIVGGTDVQGYVSASIDPGNYTMELVDATGVVRLQTSTLAFAANRANILSFYGNETGAVEYLFNSPVWSGLSKDTTLATFTNLSQDHSEGRLELCVESACSVVAANLKYGTAWSGVAPLGAQLVYAPTESTPLAITTLGDFFLALEEDEDEDEQGVVNYELRLHQVNFLNWTSDGAVTGQFGEQR